MLDVREQAANKQFLRSIADNDYEIPGSIDCFAFAKALLPNFSSVDGEIRDELSYMILANGILDKQKLTPEQLKELVFTTLDQDHLFYRIGEVGKDSVFMRSFSNLILAAILYKNAQTPALPFYVIREVKAALLRYARQEKDWRSYIEGKGWAHAIAHLADALDLCIQSPSMTQADRQEVMQLVRELARLPVPLYREEDVRLATIAYHVIACKQVTDEFLKGWLAGCYVPRSSDVVSWTRTTNMKNFLRSLYFYLSWDNSSHEVQKQISALLRREDALYIETSDREKGL